jgi:hypothetical protein
MRLDPKIIQGVKEAQERVFRLAKRDHNLTLKAISLDAGIDYDSLCNYAKGETQMPIAVLYALIGIIPANLLSLLLPDGHSIVRVPDNIDHDAMCEWAEAYTAKKLAAHRKDSECEEAIGPNELADLDSTVVHLPLRGKVA